MYLSGSLIPLQGVRRASGGGSATAAEAEADEAEAPDDIPSACVAGTAEAEATALDEVVAVEVMVGEVEVIVGVL